METLSGKTALVTGGGTGLGRAIAKRFHEEGASVVICGRREEKLIESSQYISPEGSRIYYTIADITLESDIKRLVDETIKQTGRLDILVNNAGVMRTGRLHETTIEAWDLMVNTNTFGPWRLMVHAVPHMRNNGGGSIINISSLAGIKAFPSVGIYGVSKVALQLLSQVMAMETAADNIRINCILPAQVEDTELGFAKVGEEHIRKSWDKQRPLHPMQRNGKPIDIANAALFFASDQSSWITGTLLSADGGRHMATNRPEN